MPWPPFNIPECDPPPEDVQRTTAPAAPTRGNTIQPHTPPVAELRIHYEMQFRFVQFYKLRAATPYWENVGDDPMTLADLTQLVARSPDGWLPTDDRFVHIDDDRIDRNAQNQLVRIPIPTSHQVRTGRTTMNLAFGESRKISWDTSSRRTIWVPLSGSLPTHVPMPEGAGNWRAPEVLQERNQDYINPRQWGIRGTMDLTMDPCGAAEPVHSYKMCCVWERFGLYRPGEFSIGMAMLPASTDIDNPAVFAGFPRAMALPANSTMTFTQWMDEFPAIQVAHEWSPVAPTAAQQRGNNAAVPQNPGGAGWLNGARAWRVKNPDSWMATGAVCIHTGNMPNWFLGCQGPGKEDHQTEWGFKTKNHSRDTMWEIVQHLGVTRRQFHAHGMSPPHNQKRWVVIRVTAEPDAITDDGFKSQTIWLPEPANLAVPAGRAANAIDI